VEKDESQKLCAVVGGLLLGHKSSYSEPPG
jgi:hypothetical protein